MEKPVNKFIVAHNSYTTSTPPPIPAPKPPTPHPDGDEGNIKSQ